MGVIMSACNAVRRVPDGRHLLMKNEISVNGKKEKREEVNAQIYQKPNSQILGYRLRLNLYNLAKINPDSSYRARFYRKPGKYRRMAKILSAKQVNRLGKSFYYYGIHNFLKKSGEAPVIIDTLSTKKSAARLRSYYFNNGYFDTKTSYEIDTLSRKKAKIKYSVETGEQYILDSIYTSISSPVIDSLYEAIKSEQIIKSGRRYRTVDFEAEKNRLTSSFRNRGVYNFQQNYVRFNIDTIGQAKRNLADVDVIIGDYSYRQGDTTLTSPFKIFKISRVNIFTTNPSDKTFENAPTDSTVYNNFHIYSNGKLRYKPKALTNAVFLAKDEIFADYKTTLTSRYLSNLRVFEYPTITYVPDSTGNGLVANIYLVSEEKYTWGAGIDVTHSNIQDFGIAGNARLNIRNVFNGAETFEISGRGNIGSSKYFANPDDSFFNVLEYGGDMRLSLPQILLPFRTERIIPKRMIPSTVISFGISKQQNIGLDKENFTGSMTYNWTPKRYRSAKFDLFNIQYVNNVNIGNYFKIYRSSYNALNNLAQEYNAPASYFGSDGNLTIDSGTNAFINDVLGPNPAIDVSPSDLRTITNINDRRTRLTENNLIFASSYSYSKTTKTDPNDNTFHVFRAKIESAGNFLSLIARISDALKNQDGATTFLGVAYSQYFKTEGEFIKHISLGRKKVLAMRAFGGIAIPYGNSDNIPFSRSYFAGGSNDNRAWLSYRLGPGRARTINDFNEANLKIALSIEYRFNLFGGFNGALFVDAGNIWNVLDDTVDERMIFENFRSLEDIAIGSGFGIRYDFGFFVARLDIGFKTYNPAELENKWFREYDFKHSVLNVGINYPF